MIIIGERNIGTGLACFHCTPFKILEEKMRTLKQIYKKCKFKNREIQDQDNVLKEK